MNILIVGNGFDLSHYLPTKYDHFMDMMRAIEESQNETMNFDELFSECREGWFIAKTKQYYLTENIILEKEQLENIRGLLKENCWYHYFKNHVKEVKTWIDFEIKIQEVLLVIGEVFNDILNIKDIDRMHEYFNKGKEFSIFPKNLKIIDFFKFTSQEEVTKKAISQPMYGGSTKYENSKRINVSKKFCYGNEIKNGFSPASFLIFLYDELEKFIEIFDLYLDLIVYQLSPIGMPTIKSNSWIEPDKIYSFNYTNTYQRIYDSVEVDYLHGSHGEFQNIVLGISDLEDASLKKLKAYGFTKYHQKLFKDTDYLFLDEYKQIVTKNTQQLISYDASNFENPAAKMGQRRLWERKGVLDLNILIWGHSLDFSDRDYILDLFSLNDDIDRNVRITVYYFDKPAKFSLLNNILAILGKDKVEQWMKNKWLTFEPNPEIDFGIQEESDLEKQAS